MWIYLLIINTVTPIQCEALIPKPIKDIAIEKNNRSISFMNIDEKNPTKY